MSRDASQGQAITAVEMRLRNSELPAAPRRALRGPELRRIFRLALSVFAPRAARTDWRFRTNGE